MGANMNLTAEQRRALEMLATSGRDGATQPLLAAHGFGAAGQSGAALSQPYFLRTDHEPEPVH